MYYDLPVLLNAKDDETGIVFSMREGEIKEKFVSKFPCCRNLLWQFGIDFI